MSFRFIEDHRDTYPVRLMCAVIEVSPAGYYAWRDRPPGERTKSNAALLTAIRQAHRDSCGRYGSPRVHAVLRRQGRGISRGRIERMMRRHPRHHGSAAPGSYNRQPSRPADRTEPDRARLHGPSPEPGLACRYPLHSDRRGLAVSGRRHGSVQPKDRRLRHAGSYAGRTHLRSPDNGDPEQRPQAGLIHHSDRGVQYASCHYRTAL